MFNHWKTQIWLHLSHVAITLVLLAVVAMYVIDHCTEAQFQRITWLGLASGAVVVLGMYLVETAENRKTKRAIILDLGIRLGVAVGCLAAFLAGANRCMALEVVETPVYQYKTEGLAFHHVRDL